MIEYKRIITDAEQKYLEHDLLDIADWIDQAIAGKIHNCMKRAAKEYDEIAKNENFDSVPAKLETKATALFARESYKNRQQRENER